MREIEVYVKGPGAGREAAIRSLQAAGLEVNLDQGRDPDSPQRLPSAEAAAGLIGVSGGGIVTHGKVHWTRLPAVPA